MRIRCCSVGTLKIYRARTNFIRKQNPQNKKAFHFLYARLFQRHLKKIQLQVGLDPSSNKCPHPLIQLPAHEPHKVWAMSASLAWRANIGPQDIFSAAYWSNHTTLRWTPFIGTSGCGSESCFPVDRLSPLFLFIYTLYILHFEWELRAEINTIYF